MRDVMDLSGHQERRLITESTCSPDLSGFAKVSVPAAFLPAVSNSIPRAARPFAYAVAILNGFVCPLVDRIVDVHSRRLNVSRKADDVFRCRLPFRDSIHAFLMRPLNGPLSRIVFCSSLA
jgi:hypothetical protein